MILSTTFDVPGKKIKQNLGIVIGNVVRAKHLGKDIRAGLRNLVGGEVKQYTQLLSEARTEAIKRMEREAKKKNADAIIGVRIATSSISQLSSEVVAYGTAVKLGK